ncbi:MAG: hypothetical protein RLZZ555_459, partial [Pseudomonadota bacterium]
LHQFGMALQQSLDALGNLVDLLFG